MPHNTNANAPKSLWRRIFMPSLFSLSWYITSIGLTLFNKWFFTVYKFHYPVFTTCFHSFTIAIFARVLFRSHQMPTLAWDQYLNYIVPVGIFAGADIALSNISLLYITVTLYTMVKAGIIVWVLMFSFAFRLEKPTFKLVAIIIFVVAGILLATYGDTKFDPFGFVMVFIASILAGARWTSCQYLMQNDRLQLDPKTTIYFVTPVQGLCLVPMFLFLEAKEMYNDGYFQFSLESMQVYGILFLAAVLVFGLNLSEFLLIHHTSTLTMSVVGTLKEMLTISLSVLIFHDELSMMNSIGFTVCMVGIVGYKVIRYQKIRESEALTNPTKKEMKELSLGEDEGTIDRILHNISSKKHTSPTELDDAEQRQILISDEIDEDSMEEIELDFTNLKQGRNEG
eukprot:TRINITY_DN7736_c0_g1_i2.p1 TRINITY_DN7736_c0_g1~~TRINITY_DN7736_c0_g1_i2.p1  ORF type:complete len:397 (-),score=74.73 TRINITY_DN7736_c0_g1_i2:213-1403(-)